MGIHYEVKSATEKMKSYLTEIDNIYEGVRSTGEAKDFYFDVKPFVDEVHAHIEKWCTNAKEWVQTYRPKNLFPQQIEAAKENIKEICVQAFYPNTSYSRFKHNVHSINYILEKLLKEVSIKEAQK